MIHEAEDRRHVHEDRPIGEAAWDVIEAGHRVLLDRIELLVLEARQAVDVAQRRAALFLLAVVVLAAGWIGVNGTVALALEGLLSRVAIAGLLTALNVILGVALLTWAWRREV